MRAIRRTYLRRSRRALTSAFARLVCIAGFFAVSFAPANAANAPMRIAIGAPIRVASGATFAVHVLAAGAPIFVIASERVHSIFLEVDGRVVAAGGSASGIHWQPFGHTVTSLRLSALTPRNRVLIRTVGGGSGGLIVASDVSLLTSAAHVGLFSGFYFAFLLLIALFHVLTPATSRDRANLWYAAWALIIAANTAGRDGYFGVTQFAEGIVPVSALLLAVCSVGFTASFLRLRREAPRLLWIAIALNVIAFITPLVVMAIIHRHDEWIFIGGMTAAILPLIVAAIVRRRDGFLPATALAAGFCLHFCTFGLQIVLGVADVAPPLLQHWGMELATVVNLLVLTVALLVRRRYALREMDGLEAELGRSRFDANHDELTGLLNRRGLDVWLRSAGHMVSTVFFIDLDGFKSINDRGGHAAGDDVLRIVGRIIRHAVREGDAVARVGGDEFVIAFGGYLTELQTLELQRRIAGSVSVLEPLGDRDATRIGASVGIGSVGGRTTIEAAMREADADAYRIKLSHHAVKRAAHSQG